MSPGLCAGILEIDPSGGNLTEKPIDAIYLSQMIQPGEE